MVCVWCVCVAVCAVCLVWHAVLPTPSSHSKRPPYVQATRPHIFYTCGRFAGTHGDVFNVLHCRTNHRGSKSMTTELEGCELPATGSASLCEGEALRASVLPRPLCGPPTHSDERHESQILWAALPPGSLCARDSCTSPKRHGRIIHQPEDASDGVWPRPAVLSSAAAQVIEAQQTVHFVCPYLLPKSKSIFLSVFIFLFIFFRVYLMQGVP